MTIEVRRRCGVVFQDISVDKAAAKCARAAATWGGLAMVFVDPAGLVEAIVPGTLCADMEMRHRAADLVGIYTVPHQRDRHAAARQLIAGDIWCHMQQMSARHVMARAA